MDRIASISAYIRDFMGIIKEREKTLPGRNPLGQNKSKHQRISMCPFQGQVSNCNKKNSAYSTGKNQGARER